MTQHTDWLLNRRRDWSLTNPQLDARAARRAGASQRTRDKSGSPVVSVGISPPGEWWAEPCEFEHREGDQRGG
jgi:hypothetical protein